MASSKPSESKVPSALVKQHQNEWHGFTRAVTLAAAHVAVLLLLLLLFFRVL